ncbi:MAG: DUF3035 domain-containing protein [Pseudomonadota bacterium]
MKKSSAFGLATIVALSSVTAACTGGARRTPDEFRVVRKAPLTIPPEYNLRPPAPGESRPQELQPDAQARTALFGESFGQGASDGERLLVAKAGGDAVDPNIRTAVDFDATATLRKGRRFSDRVLFWTDEDDALSEDPVDPNSEAERITAEQSAVDNATGGGEVVIKHGGSSRVKLPGL